MTTGCDGVAILTTGCYGVAILTTGCYGVAIFFNWLLWSCYLLQPVAMVLLSSSTGCYGGAIFLVIMRGCYVVVYRQLIIDRMLVTGGC